MLDGRGDDVVALRGLCPRSLTRYRAGRGCWLQSVARKTRSRAFVRREYHDGLPGVVYGYQRLLPIAMERRGDCQNFS